MVSERNLTTPTRRVFGDVKKGTRCRICGRDVDDGRAKYCSDYCRKIAKAVLSMLNWGSVRRRILDRDGGACQKCGFKQEWIDRGHDHLREIVESKCPERPESPPLDEYADLSDDEIRQHRERFKEWEKQCWVVSREYLGYRWHPGGLDRGPHSKVEVDHITPVSEGGHPFDPANLWTLCEDCHGEKTAREAAERAEQRALARPDIEAELVDFVTGGGESDV